jgi:hypothetical protein
MCPGLPKITSASTAGFRMLSPALGHQARFLAIAGRALVLS